MESDETFKDELILDISGKGLDRKDLFGSSDPFLAFYRINEDGRFNHAWKINGWQPDEEQRVHLLRVIVLRGGLEVKSYCPMR
ncbi:hypothetical protein T265_06236 [Opisthorchis viverrini]|uniref:C2 domain-containing protein n=1 Tax=Opisthorchis viverrini TaxID=6198 RepID=A0A074ZGV8_OPIVI|nr:hypothetical protein T265_06236 [Opisthorchis viverrini]KER26516.1 hypothetical protein T265_06236 [Opisthorchis viverrini]